MARITRVAISLLVAVSCGGDSTTPPANNPLPVLISVDPPQLTISTTPVTVTIKGSGFAAKSQVRWNDGDRVTHFQNTQTLTVDLALSDVASPTVGKIVVVNGAPGGGTSGQLSILVGFPKPTIASVSPARINIPPANTTVRLTIAGSGFAESSTMYLGDYYFSPISATSTQLVYEVSNTLFPTPGRYPVRIINPQPGGGTSNSVDFEVAYPAPTITTLAPDSVFTGASFTLTVNGSGFGNGSVIRWNGADRTTTYVNSTQLTAVIPASDVANESTAQVTVFSPTPGGGTSSALPVRVREAPPVMNGISPGVVAVGSPATDVVISGSNFRVGATVQWDGQLRNSSRTSSTSMSVQLTAADLSAAHVGTLTVTNPGASGTSNGLALAVVASGAKMTIERTISLVHSDLVYDPARGLLYASVPNSGGSQYAHSIVSIDPSTGRITGSIQVGSNPGPLAITDDEQFLYVGFLTDSKIVRVALSTFSKDIELNLAIDSYYGPTVAREIVPIPGAPRTIAVSTSATGGSPFTGTYVYDDTTRRPSPGPGAIRITRSASAARIYGLNNESTEIAFRSLSLAADGLHEEVVTSTLFNTYVNDIEYDGGFVFATNGQVIDVRQLADVGRLPATGVVRPDAANARVHVMEGGAIRTFHYNSLTKLGEFFDQAVSNHARLIRWGRDGLAAGGGSTIVLLRGALVAP